MARHRQRARERKLRQPDHHENVSGELEHASGEVEEFDAALVAGAEGEPGGLAEEPMVDQEDEEDDEVAVPARRPRDRVARSGPQPGGGRALNFLQASWAELQRVQWPDRRQVAQATAVVLGFVALAGAYLGLADLVAQKVVNLII